MTKAERKCDTCKYWTFEGLLQSPARAGNEGICAFFLYSGRDTKAPVWAEDLSQATISFEGKNCLAWAKKSNRAIKARGTL